MVIPKSIYEILPYAYLSISIAALIIQHSEWMVFTGVVFYILACLVLVKRSANRRLDRQKQNGKKKSIPHHLYEFLPFIYIAFAGGMLLFSNVYWLQFVAAVLAIIAMRNILFRHQNRANTPSKF